MKNFTKFLSNSRTNLDESSQVEEFSEIKKIMSKDVKKIRKNLFEGSSDVNRMYHTYKKLSPSETKAISALEEVEELLDKARKILYDFE